MNFHLPHPITFVFSLMLTLLGSSHAIAADKQLLKSADPEMNKQYVRERFGKYQNKAFDKDDNKKKLLLIGDSQAQDFLNTAAELGRFDSYQIRTRHIPAQCQPYLGSVEKSGVKRKDKALCDRVDSLQKAKAQIANADVIIFASLWRKWAIEQLPTTIKNMALKPKQKLIVIGPKSFGKISLRHYLRMSNDERLLVRNRIAKKFFNYNEALRKHISQNSFVDQYTIICGKNEDTCPVFTDKSELISFDGGHLTKAGAIYVGKKIFKSKALSGL